MAKWSVAIYVLDGLGGHSDAYHIEDDLISASLKYTINDTNKFQFSVPVTTHGSLISNVLPLKSYVTVDRVGTGNSVRRMFVGLVEKRTYSVLDGVYTFECCGGLGAQKYMPPYRHWSAGVSPSDVAAQLDFRYKGWADPPYATYNPSALYSGEFDLFDYGRVIFALVDDAMTFNSNIEQIQSSSSTAADFIKSAYLNVENYENFGQHWGNPFIYELPDGSIILSSRFAPDPLVNINSQEIRYDRNLISCEITEDAYYTIAEVNYNGSTGTAQTSDYPFPFGFKDYVPAEPSGGTYSQFDLDTIAGGLLSGSHKVITASAFDEGILDNGTDFLNISKYVNLVYLENGVEKTEVMEITSITYDLTNPSRDRVQLGKKIIPLTQRS